MSYGPGSVTRFARHHFRHFNAAALVRAADGYLEFLRRRGKVMVALGGAMSTAELGVSLAEMIRSDRAHAIVCTGANLEEDLFRLIARDEYRYVRNYRCLSTDDEVALGRQNLNRVTDVCLPDDLIWERLEKPFLRLWSDAERNRLSLFPHEHVYDLLRSGAVEEYYQIQPSESWLHAAMLADLPIFVPGWEDSSLGNMYAGALLRGAITDPTSIRSGIETVIALDRWKKMAGSSAGLGLLQVGGGIAGHFAGGPRAATQWGYFCRIGDSPLSFGSCSGAEAPYGGHVIESDATVVAPLIFAMVLDQ